jgi:hypothetical protein
LFGKHVKSGAALFGFPFGYGDWNLADAYTDAASHFRRVFSPRFFGCCFRFEWFRHNVRHAVFVVEQKPFISKLAHEKSYQTSHSFTVSAGVPLADSTKSRWVALPNKYQHLHPGALDVFGIGLDHRTSRMICSGSIFKAMRPYAMPILALAALYSRDDLEDDEQNDGDNGSLSYGDSECFR